MKNWKIIAWLIMFFPLGLYYMYQYANWPKKVVYGIAGIYGIFTLVSIWTGGLHILGLLLGTV